MAPLHRDLFLKVRVTADEKRMLEEIADLAGVSASDWIRLRIREAYVPAGLSTTKAARDVDAFLNTAMGGKAKRKIIERVEEIERHVRRAQPANKRK